MGKKYLLKLFLCDDSDRNNTIAERLKLGLEEHMQNSYNYDVVVLLNNPKIAIEKRIIVTPTLEITCQGRMKRVIGEVSDVKKVLEIIKQF
ncbi:MAG: hypothetical protein FJ264_08360 [Planctomycetes bacterium]|nr:hypothetical protein [Planctomycetota bacterium]